MSTHDTYSPLHTITTTAKREIQILFAKKSVTITLLIMLLAIVGLIGFAAWQKDKDPEDSAQSVAVVDVDKHMLEGSGLEPRDAADRAEAERLVRDGDVDAALIAEDNEWQVISDGLPDTDVTSRIDALAEAYAQSAALEKLGVTPAEFEAASPEIDVVPVDIGDLDAGKDDAESEANFIKLLTAFILLMLIVFMVITFAAQVGSRVTEEKSSRVVELILSTVRPLDFLAGKILGNLVFGFISTAILVAAAGIALKVTGLLEDVDIAWSILPVMLLSYLLAMVFFGGLYAAAGAMVQRTEDLQSTQMPVLLLIIASAYVPAFGWMNTDATWMQVFSWIPPVSIFAAPLSYAAGDFTALQLAGSLAIAAVATCLVIWLTARIYRRSILNNGKTTKWSEALRG
ncbi:ABC transporter permease [Corynebacterium gottingense]|uniref:ABC transporter permease n=1 Tax=Corynebacterium gottingense TaxID=2041036 RepID=A0ABX9UH58_9CORY|nr:ABC transporter permease [Corynebacterium gottingense]RMD17639.1 ABC transporter permease [Corynebacterium gottingense]WJZ12604.1 ABC-2 family transporter protein [Corynebacterium gottingense]